MTNVLGDKQVFTTGEIAGIFDVNINTVVKWFEEGLLKGFKFPGFTARRVPRRELLDFIARQRFPVKEVELRSVNVLLVTSNRAFQKRFHAAIEDAFGYKLQTASNAFEAGLACAETTPAVIFTHLGYSDFDLVKFRRVAGQMPELSRTRFIAAGKKRDIPEGFDGLLQLPVSSDGILDVIDRTVAGSARAMKIPFSKH